MPKKPPTVALATVRRMIYFYRVRNGPGSDGVTFDHASVLKEVNALPYTPPNRERYQSEDDGNEVCAWIDGASKVRFGRTRHRGLPQVENSLTLSAIPIPANAGISDLIHILFFKDNVVGADFNFYGPRMSRFAWYLRDKCPTSCPRIEFNVLPRPEIVKQLDTLEGLSLFSMRVMPSYVSTLKQADQDVAAMFEAQLNLGVAKDYEVVIRSERNRSLTERLRKFIKRVMRRDDVSQGVSSLEVHGLSRLTGKVEAIDLLRDQLIARKDIIPESVGTRALDKDAAYAAIAKAYQELKDQIAEAADISD